MNMDDNFIKEILEMNPERERQYTFMLCLRTARFLLGCDLETGEYKKENLNEEIFVKKLYISNIFSGLANYLIFLETIGTIFKPKSVPINNKENGIHKALSYFSDLDENQIVAIRTLRNSLAHNFSLAIKSNTNNRFTQKFILLHDDSIDEIIKLSTSRWGGDYSDKTNEKYTIINIKKLICLIEDIYTKVAYIASENELECMKSKDELNTKYSILNNP